ncbi:hypothetical protein HDU67_002433 [Dinochytrium kinnereticum]|nr:hypothetical protein HDU67_002433 [Dinochytrium kinnereticum]
MLAWLYTKNVRQPTPAAAPDTLANPPTPRPPSPDVDNWILLPEDDVANDATGGTTTPHAEDTSSPRFKTTIPSTDAEADQLHDEASDVDLTQPSVQVTNPTHPSPPASPDRSTAKSPFSAPSRQYMSRKTRRRILKQLAIDRKEADVITEGALDAAAEREIEGDSDDSLTRKSAFHTSTPSSGGGREVSTLLLLQHAAAKGQANAGNSIHPVIDKMKKVESSVLKMRKAGVTDLAASTTAADWQKRAGGHRSGAMKSGRGTGTSSSGAFGMM